ncbi:hypothetical protein B0H14DRAFT_3494671 [Mycena olivaceomarginata]|nr:hypothetical protein B0H14DRAFT_3494671 [Mycena olivaceomarginata]
MSSTPAPSTPASDPLNDVFSAMDQETPVTSTPTPAQKRTRNDLSDNEDDIASGPPALLLTTQNSTQLVQRYAEKKRLRVDQIAEVNSFLKDIPAVRDAKILVNILQVGNQVNAIVVATPEYQVSASLEKTLHNFTAAILLSSRISAYKGAVPTNTLLNILRKNRFNLPPGIENKPADYAKVVASVQDAFTQLHSKFKKALSASLKVNKQDKEHAPGPKHQNIFKLTGIFVENTRCSVTIELCARVALMRQVYLVRPGVKFWDRLDLTLAEIRTKAGGNAKKITKAFAHILTKDQDLHGIKTNDPEIPQSNVDGFQQEVDDLIDAGLNDVATSAAAQVTPSTPTAQQAGGAVADD